MKINIIHRIATVVVLLPALLILSCNRYKVDEDAYRKGIEKWHTERVERLKSKNGWLNLAGLFWLKQGLNTFGSDSANLIVFPAKAPGFMGTIALSGESATLAENRANILVDSMPVGNCSLRVDTTGNPSVMTWGSLAWHIIKRGDRVGIRLRDYASPLIEKISEVPYYPISSKWRIIARYEAFEQPRKQVVRTVIGTDAENIVPGVLSFKIEGKKMKLYPVQEGKELSLVFGDLTNGEETYGGGRFLDLEGPDEHGMVILDFNQAYNPPCSFTPYATCQLPHRDNLLPLKVEAGEKAMHLVPGH